MMAATGNPMNGEMPPPPSGPLANEAPNQIVALVRSLGSDAERAQQAPSRQSIEGGQRISHFGQGGSQFGVEARQCGGALQEMPRLGIQPREHFG